MTQLPSAPSAGCRGPAALAGDAVPPRAVAEAPSDQTYRPSPGRHALIVGGGASGVLMAAHLLALKAAGWRVTVIEGRNMLGCGVAYSTTDPDHLLNTRVHNMSAYRDDPEHFLHWLQERPETGDASPTSFVSRETYGAYMAGLLGPWQDGPERWRLSCLRESCIRIEETATGVTAHLADGRSIAGDVAILATGHVQPEADRSGLLTSAWDHSTAIDREERVVIIGTGLSMVDQVLSLLRRGHRGEIVSVSRRGQLPRAHTATKPLAIRTDEIPQGGSVSALFHWTRGLARRAEAEGGSWRDAVDGLRPHVRAIWRGLPEVARARFLRHAAAWWDVHRHRIPPASEARIREALDSGRLRLVRGAFTGAERDPQGRLIARVQPAVGERLEIPAGRIIDCRGIRRDPEQNASPLMADLLQRGAARLDGLRIGLDVSADCRIIDRAGHPSARVRAIGPVSRAAFWEITAIPDIREQTSELARDLATDPVMQEPA